jgi:hypothetical protein
MTGLHIRPTQWGSLPELHEAFPLDDADADSPRKAPARSAVLH